MDSITGIDFGRLYPPGWSKLPVIGWVPRFHVRVRWEWHLPKSICDALRARSP